MRTRASSAADRCRSCACATGAPTGPWSWFRVSARSTGETSRSRSFVSASAPRRRYRAWARRSSSAAWSRPTAFDAVLAESRRTGALTGELLVARGTVRRLDLYRTLSDLWGIPFCDLKHTEPDIELVSRFGLDPATLARKPWIPIGEAQGVLLVATCERPTDRLAEDVRAECNWTGAVVFHATTEWDLRAAVLRAHGAELTRRAASELAERVPEESASRVLTRPQALVLAAIGVALLALLVLSGKNTLVTLFLLFNVSYAGNVGFKVAAIAAGVIRLRGRAVRGTPEPPRSPTATCRCYTILVPAYGEANVIADLVGHLRPARLPARPARGPPAARGGRPARRSTRRCSAGLPRRSCASSSCPTGSRGRSRRRATSGCSFARGEFLVIFDAEDRPDPDQLKKAVAAFRSRRPRSRLPPGAPELLQRRARTCSRACSRSSTAHWFDLMLEGLVALRLPIPLGGTSNHFRTDALRELGGWDSAQRHRGRRPRHARRRAGLTVVRCSPRRPRGGQLPAVAMDPPALALDQGLHPDLARPHAPPDPVRRVPPGRTPRSRCSC